ncbi:hypothetical protein ABZ137_41290 [Streptomyces bobili]|uniref:hypothetical protein n=1 Tax=Streptomyces bobili TaxID=67280 RepID=UPI0033A0F833
MGSAMIPFRHELFWQLRELGRLQRVDLLRRGGVRLGELHHQPARLGAVVGVRGLGILHRGVRGAAVVVADVRGLCRVRVEHRSRGGTLVPKDLQLGLDLVQRVRGMAQPLACALAVLAQAKGGQGGLVDPRPESLAALALPFDRQAVGPQIVADLADRLRGLGQ